MFLLFCGSFCEMGTFHLVHFVVYRWKDWYILQVHRFHELVHFTSDVYELYMSWAELKHWTTSHIWWVDILSWYMFTSSRILWTGRAIHAQTCHYEKWIVRSTPRTKKNEKAANNNFMIIIALLWHKVRKQILMTNRLMFILSTSNKQNKQLWNVVTTCTWGATCGG